jgi:integrase
MARVYKRGKTWTYCVDVGPDKDGKRDRVTKGGFRTEKEARLAAAQVEVDQSTGALVRESEISFKDFSESWIKIYAATNVKKSSVRIRQHEVNNLLFYFNNIKLREVTKKQYQDALLNLSKRGFAENTIAGIHGTAKMLFKKAVELDIIKNDPTKFARPPRKQQTIEDIENADELPKYLEKENLATFLRFAHDAGLQDDYPVFMLLAYSGVRAGELCALKWSDVDFENHTISITKTYYNPNNNLRQYELLPPKTKTAIRQIDISPRVIQALTLHQAWQRKAKMKNRDIWHDHNFVFTLDRYPGYPIYIKRVEERMARIMRLSGLPQELTPHSLRHTHTSLLAEAGVGLEEIMQRLGHIDDDTTRRVYLHVTKQMKKEAAHKFDALMDNL